MSALGFVALTYHHGTWNVLTQKSLSRSNTRHIDEEEAHAVSWAIDELSEYITTMKPDALIIAIDNLVVSRSLLRGVSGSPRADYHIQLSLDKLEKLCNLEKLSIADIASEDNVADIYSRKRDNTSADYNIRLQLSKKVATRALTNLNKNIRWCPRELKNTNN